jgi:hydrocephalus-inducing protein
MEIFYIIRFKPQQVRKHFLELVCSTEREKFLVPIFAVGMSPRMTFPDEINFGTCPVKSSARKSFLVQNSGMIIYSPVTFPSYRSFRTYSVHRIKN